MFRRLSPTESVALLIWQEPRMPKALDVICSKDSTAKSPAGDIKTEGKCITGYISFISVCFRCYYLTSNLYLFLSSDSHIFFTIQDFRIMKIFFLLFIIVIFLKLYLRKYFVKLNHFLIL